MYLVMLATDLHLTSKPDDAYRWAIFNWMLNTIKEYKIKELFLLGDLTNEKDNHSSELVNKITSNIGRLSDKVIVRMIKGNHDYIDPENPYMHFLNQLKNEVHFYSRPELVEFSNGKFAWFLPNTRNPIDDWVVIDFNESDFIFLHQTFKGALLENGQKMQDGTTANIFNGVDHNNIYSGDIHVPQEIGSVIYVGCPYPIRYGDKFKPRVILLDLDTENYKELNPPSIRKWMLEIKHPDDLNNYGIEEDDFVKVRLKLSRSDYPMWDEYKKKIIEHIEDFSGANYRGVKLIKRKERVKLNTKERDSTKVKGISNDIEAIQRFSDNEELNDSRLVNYGIRFLK